jgi:hypothetical protein
MVGLEELWEQEMTLLIAVEMEEINLTQGEHKEVVGGDLLAMPIQMVPMVG